MAVTVCKYAEMHGSFLVVTSTAYTLITSLLYNITEAVNDCEAVSSNTHIFSNPSSSDFLSNIFPPPPPPAPGTSYMASCDVYSFGVVLWEMITRHKPYLAGTQGKSMAPQSVMYRVATGIYS